MKKIFAFIAIAMFAVASYGKASEKQLQLTNAEGVAVIFDATKKANVEIVFAENCTASYQGTQFIPFATYVELNKEWDEEWAEASKGFAQDWNSRNKKGMRITTGDADYKIIIKINSFKEMAAFNVWWEIVDGSVEIVENLSNRTIVAYNINEYYEGVSGFKALKLRNRIKETLAGLSESCLYFAKKKL